MLWHSYPEYIPPEVNHGPTYIAPQQYSPPLSAFVGLSGLGTLNDGAMKGHHLLFTSSQALTTTPLHRGTLPAQYHNHEWN